MHANAELERVDEQGSSVVFYFNDVNTNHVTFYEIEFMKGTLQVRSMLLLPNTCMREIVNVECMNIQWTHLNP